MSEHLSQSEWWEREDRTYPSKRIGTCGKCGGAVRESHIWVRMFDRVSHLSSCEVAQRDDAYNLLKRIREGLEDGLLNIPDVCHAVEAEIKEMTNG